MKEEKVRLLFVCLGNICRSPSAEAVMKRLVKDAGLGDRIEIDSAGITGYHEGDRRTDDGRFRGSCLPQSEGTYRGKYQRLGEQDHRRADRRRLAKERSVNLQGRGDREERIRRQAENDVPYSNQLSGLEKTIIIKQIGIQPSAQNHNAYCKVLIIAVISILRWAF